MISCRICGNVDRNKSYIAREMMFGYRDRFEYIECEKCGCVQIKDIPADMSKYYPSQYYSLQKEEFRKEGLLKSFIRHQRATYCLYRKNLLGMLLSKISRFPNYYEWFRKVKVDFSSFILDVGCGSGQLLKELQREGFSNLLGVDPYIDKDLSYGDRLKILKKQVMDVDQQFDFIMMLHSFEHMPEPLSVVRALNRLLKPDRYALIRIPIASSYAWRTYGTNWAQLDPPRHLFLHSLKSMEIMAEKVGLQIKDIVFDSTEFQFYASEQHIKDVPLRDDKSYWVNPEKSFFSKDQIQSFKKMAAELNEKKEGDQACFYLYKT